MPFTLTPPSSAVVPSAISEDVLTTDHFFEGNFDFLGSHSMNDNMGSRHKNEAQVKTEQTGNTDAIQSRKRGRGKISEGCVISELIDPSTMSPPIRHEAKRKRRRRAKTEEEKQQRALERKMKNRQSAMRSRQRVLNELKRDKEEIETLRKQNEQQKAQILKLQQQLVEAKAQLKNASIDCKKSMDHRGSMYSTASCPCEGETDVRMKPTPSSLSDIECQPNSSFNPLSVFDDPSSLDFLDALPPSSAAKLEKLDSIDLNDYKSYSDLCSDSGLIIDKSFLRKQEQDDCHSIGVDSNIQSGCDSDSIYHENAFFGCARNLNKLKSVASTYNFSWLSEILRLRIQLQTEGKQRSIQMKNVKVEPSSSKAYIPSQNSSQLSNLCKFILRNPAL